MRAVLPALAALAIAASLAIADDAIDIKSEALRKKPQADRENAVKEKGGPLRVDGIVHGPEGAFAIIDGRTYLKGEGGEGFLVKDIYPSRVLIESGDGLEYLQPSMKRGQAQTDSQQEPLR